LDLVCHGSRFVLIEFAGAAALAGGLAALSLRSGLRQAHRSCIDERVQVLDHVLAVCFDRP